MYRDSSKSIDERVEALLAMLTAEEKMGLLCGHQHAIERLGIKERYIGTEYARGWSSHDETQFCTVLPQTIGMASTFDEELIHTAGLIAGRESRAYYNSVNKSIFGFGPTVDLLRDPRWGRNEEGYGEDPCLTGRMSTAYTKGIVGDGEYKQALPLLKHFICNNTETNRATYDAKVSNRLLNEYYLEVFRKPITEGGAFGVMDAYNKINGEPGLLSSLNQKYVKDAWGGKLVVSDGHAFAMVMDEHKYTNSHAETLALALKAGANIMLDAPEMVMEAAKEAYDTGLIDDALLDRAVSDVLALRFELGEFDEVEPYLDVTMDMVNTDDDKKVALKMCEEQVVLLKNNGILPLKTPKKLAIVGPQADENFLDWYTGASSYDITVVEGFKEALADAEIVCDNGRDLVRIKELKTGKYLRINEDMSVCFDAEISDAAQFERYDWGSGYVNFKDAKSGKMLTEDENIIKCTAKDAYMWFVRPILTPHEKDGGVYFTSWNKQNIVINEQMVPIVTEEGEPSLMQVEVISCGDDRCEALAKDADAVIVCAGNHPVQVGREGYDRDDIKLPPRQEGLAKRMLAVNANTILLMVSSYPYGVEELDEQCSAVVYTTHAGPELGRAVANIFLGKANPSGRLASTWYRSDFEFPSIYDYDIETNKMTYLYMDKAPLYPFGYGLSYSKFNYSNFAVTGETDDKICFGIDVSNTSNVDGAEIVQIYYDRADSAYKRPNKKMVSFGRVSVKAGTTEHLELVMDKELLKSYEESADKLVLEGGEYRFSAAKDSANMILELQYRIK